MRTDDEAARILHVNGIVAGHKALDGRGALVDFDRAAVERLDDHAVVAVWVDVRHLECEVGVRHQALQMVDAVVFLRAVERVDFLHELVVLLCPRLRRVELRLQCFGLAFEVGRAVCELSSLQVRDAVAPAHRVVARFNLVNVRFPICRLGQTVDDVPRPRIVRRRSEADVVIDIDCHVSFLLQK